jgi:hypothetical protein
MERELLSECCGTIRNANPTELSQVPRNVLLERVRLSWLRALLFDPQDVTATLIKHDWHPYSHSSEGGLTKIISGSPRGMQFAPSAIALTRCYHAAGTQPVLTVAQWEWESFDE